MKPVMIIDRQPAAATPQTETAQTSSPRDRVAHEILRLAGEYYQKQQLAEARDFLALLDAAGAHTAETLQTLGNVSVLLGDQQAAAVAFSRALAFQPGNVALLVALALTDMQQHQNPDASAYLTRALTLEPENVDALKLLADWHLARRAFREAAAIYGRLLGRHPRQVDILLSVAKCCFRLGDRPTAIKTLRCVLDVDPSNATALENLATLDSLEAQGTDPAVAADGPTPKQLMEQAQAAYAKGDLAAAGEILSQVTRQVPHASPVWVCLGNVEFGRGHFAEACQAYRQASEIEPRNVEVLVRLATSCLECDDVAGFEASLARALELDANNGPARRLLADANFSAGHFADAATEYGRLLDEAPNDPDLLLLLGNCHFQNGKATTARECFERVLELDPSHPTARANLRLLNQRPAPAAQAETETNPSLELVS